MGCSSTKSNKKEQVAVPSTSKPSITNITVPLKTSNVTVTVTSQTPKENKTSMVSKTQTGLTLKPLSEKPQIKPPSTLKSKPSTTGSNYTSTLVADTTDYYSKISTNNDCSSNKNHNNHHSTHQTSSHTSSHHHDYNGGSSSYNYGSSSSHHVPSYTHDYGGSHSSSSGCDFGGGHHH